jgi:hypothetical protein
MKSPIFIKSNVINYADLLRSETGVTKDSDFFLPHQSTAEKQANRMMGHGNPLIGAAKRSPGSTVCPSCGRNHRLGTVCFNMKSMPFNIEPADTTQLPESFTSFLFDKPATEDHPVDFASENQNKFLDSSSHMQNEQAKYLDRLRQWQLKYGGNL